MVDVVWTEGEHLPEYAKGGTMGVIDGKIVYAAGCRQPWRESETGWWFEPSENMWYPLPPMPLGRAYTSNGATAMNCLVVVGGRWRSHATPECFRLLREGGTWRWETLPRLNQPRGLAAVAAVGSFVVAVGGGDWERVKGGAFTPREVIMVEGLDLAESGKGWKALAPLPGRSRVGACAAEAGDEIFVFGGYDCWLEGDQRQLERLQSAYAYNTRANTWRQIVDPPSRLSGAAAASYRGRYIFICGGSLGLADDPQETLKLVKVDPTRKVVVGEHSNRVYAYDIKANTYHLLQGRMVHGHNDIRVAIWEDKIYAAGGENIDVTLSNTSDAFQVGQIQA